MLKGSLGEINIVEVIRLLASSNQTGQLHLMNTTDSVSTGGCFFQVGKWVHASMGRFTGLDALKEICRMSEGSFAFEVGVAPPEQSLAAYPTPALIEMVKEQVDEFQALRRATPESHERPKYIIGKTVEGLEATPEELSILLQCNGEKTVMEIAQQSGLNPVELRATLGKFRHVGLIEVVSAAATPQAPSAEPAAPPTEGSEPRVVRYWRGKPVYE